MTHKGGLLPLRKNTRLLLCLGVLFQISVVAFFYLNLYPDIQRLMPDDTLYYLQISKNIAGGHGSVFSPGEPTNGYHPLWMAILVVMRLVLSPGRNLMILFVLVLSVLLNGITALLLRRFLLDLRSGERAADLGMILYLMLPWLVLLNLSGLETPLFFMCLILFFMVIGRIHREASTSTGKYILLGAVSGLLFLSRTDSVFFILSGAGYLILKKRSMAVLRKLLLSSLSAGILTLPWLLWCWLRFGSPVQSSGMAISYWRWYTMHPVSSIEYWMINAGRMIHKLAVIFFSPFMYHADSFETIIPIVCDVLMLVAVAAAVWYLYRHRKRTNIPVYLWLPSILMLVFYTYVRIASAVWHMAVFPLLLLLLLVKLLSGLEWRSSRVIAGIALLILMNIYTLGNGFYYPQQSGDLMGNAMNLGAESDEPLVIGATDAGYLGYFSEERHIVVNLDGVVNNRAFQHIRNGTMDRYIDELDPDILKISQERLEFYTRNSCARQDR